MRGKVWLALIILTLIVGLGIGEQVYINKTFDAAIQKSEEITALIRAKNYAGASAAAEAMSDWCKGIMTAISDLQGSLAAKTYDDSLQRSISLTGNVENSKNLLTFKWKNVL